MPVFFNMENASPDTFNIIRSTPFFSSAGAYSRQQVVYSMQEEKQK